MRISVWSLVTLAGMLMPLSLPAYWMPQEDDKVTFDDHVRPIFQQRCATCHNADRRSAGLDLTNFTNLMQGGGSGESVQPGDAAGSYLFQLITHEESPEMPPGGTRIPDAEIGIVEAWINAGALENSGSVATVRKTTVAVASRRIGIRPESVARPPRMSLQPSFVSARPGVVRSLAVSPWTHLAALSAAKQILLYDTRSRELLGTLPYPEGQANVIRFSRNGQLLLAGGGRHGLSGNVVVWDVATGQRVMEVGSEVDNVLAADISADHSRIALGGPAKMLRVYSTTTGELVYEIKKHTEWITALEFSPDGILLASADRNGGLHLWETESGNEYLKLGGHDGSIRSISWRHDANLLATAGDDGQVRLWEVENGRQVKSWKGDADSVGSISFRRAGQLVSCGRDTLVKLWQQDGKLIRQFDGLNELGVAVAACDEADVVIAANLSGLVSIWNAADGTTFSQFASNPPRLSVRLQRASEQLAEVNAALAPLKTRRSAVGQQLAQMKEKLENQRELRDRCAADSIELGRQMEQIAYELENLEQRRGQWKQELQDTELALPSIAEAISRATMAGRRLPDDEELARTVSSLTASHQRYSQRVQELNRQIEESAHVQADRRDERERLQSQVEQSASRLARAEEDLGQIQLQLEPLQHEQQKLAAELEKSSARQRECEAEVERWKAEIDFDTRLNQLLQAWQEAQQRVEQDDAVVESAAERLRAAEAEYQRRLEEKASSEEAAAELQEQIRKLRVPR